MTDEPTATAANPRLDYGHSGTPPSRWMHWAALAAVAFFIALVLTSLPDWIRSRETANRVRCQSQLRAIGQAILLYINDNRGQWPTNLDVLYAASDATAEIFVCPSSSDDPAPPGVALSANPKYCSFIYVRPPLVRTMRSEWPYAEVVVAYERLTNHTDGINVLFGDGHIEWLNLGESKHLLAELKAGRSPPRPVPRK